jgi:hypothetical protein
VSATSSDNNNPAQLKRCASSLMVQRFLISRPGDVPGVDLLSVLMMFCLGQDMD